MAKYTLTKTDSPELADLKQHYLQQLASPLDGMWECFVDLGDHHSIVCENEVIGYCVVNADQKLLQFHVADLHDACEIFKQVLNDLTITGAFVATCEFPYLSLCMDLQKSVAVNACMYHVEKEANLENATFPPRSQFRIVEANELNIAVDFAIEALDADPDWLNRYFAERIDKKELFGLWQENSLVATGECRLSQTQKPHADLGMLVSKRHREQGIATNILRQLLIQCHQRGLKAICSTERENIAAQKAITKSGFISHHRILEIEL